MSAPLEGKDLKPTMSRDEVSPQTGEKSRPPSSSQSQAASSHRPRVHSRSPSLRGEGRSRARERSRSRSRGRARSRSSDSHSLSPRSTHSRSRSRSRSPHSHSRSNSISRSNSHSRSRHRCESRERYPLSPPSRYQKRRRSHSRSRSAGPGYDQQRSRSSKRRPSGSYLRRSTPPRSRSPIDDTAAYRYRFRLPDSELIAVLIGPHGERAKEVKSHANLVQLTFFESAEFDSPIGELVGSRLAIIDALRGITYMLEKERGGFSPSLSDDCGDIRQWMQYGEEYLEDLNLSKREYFQQNKRDVPQGSTLGSTTAESQSVRSEASYEEHPSRDRPSFSIEVPQQAVRHLIGSGGGTMRSIGQKCRTRVYLETFGITPVLKIWGNAQEIDSVMRMVDPIIVDSVPSWRVGTERERLGPGCEVENEGLAREREWKGTGSNSFAVVVESEPVGSRKRKADFERSRRRLFHNHYRRYREVDEPSGHTASDSKHDHHAPTQDDPTPSSSQLEVVEAESSSSSLSSTSLSFADLPTVPSSSTSISSNSPNLASPSKLFSVLEKEGCSIASSSKLSTPSPFTVKPAPDSEADSDMDSDTSVVEKPIRRRDKGKGKRKEASRGPFSGATMMARITLSDDQIAKAVTKSTPDAQKKLLSLLLRLAGAGEKTPTLSIPAAKVTRARSEPFRPRDKDNPSLFHLQNTPSSRNSTTSAGAALPKISAEEKALIEPMRSAPPVPVSPAASIPLDHNSPTTSAKNVETPEVANEGEANRNSTFTSETDINILTNALLSVLPSVLPSANPSIPEASTAPILQIPAAVSATSSGAVSHVQARSYDTCRWTSVLDPRPSQVGYSPAVQSLMLRRRVPLSSNF